MMLFDFKITCINVLLPSSQNLLRGLYRQQTSCSMSARRSCWWWFVSGTKEHQERGCQWMRTSIGCRRSFYSPRCRCSNSTCTHPGLVRQDWGCEPRPQLHYVLALPPESLTGNLLNTPNKYTKRNVNEANQANYIAYFPQWFKRRSGSPKKSTTSPVVVVFGLGPMVGGVPQKNKLRPSTCSANCICNVGELVAL